MKQIEKPISVDCVLEYDIFLRREKENTQNRTVSSDYYDNILCTKTDVINTTKETTLIPEYGDRVTIMLPDMYKNATNLICNKNISNINPKIIYIIANDIRINYMMMPHKLELYKHIKLILVESEIMKFAETNLNKPDWKHGILQKDLINLDIGDIIKIYHQTLHKGVISLCDY